MEIPGPCAVCGRQALLHTCATCGRNVCDQHHVPATNTCSICARRYGAGPAAGSLPEAPPDLPEPPGDAGDRLT